jgi:UDP-N-acetylmuramyl pentapeptide phosphotransferase/UDP-N-acetylglucosamine-1-phosphate transferase
MAWYRRLLRGAWLGTSLLVAFAATLGLYVVVFRWFEERGVTDWLLDHEPLQLVIGIPAFVGLPFFIFVFFDLLTLGRWDKNRPRIHFPWWG